MAPPAAAEVDPQPQPAAPPEVLYRTRVIDFLGHRRPIIYQDHNGPCPLIALCNVMLLKGEISLNPDASEVSQKVLLSLVTERLIDSNITTEEKDGARDLLPSLTTGMDVNMMFTNIGDFELTGEHAIFNHLDIPLYHGWIVDPQDSETATAVGTKSYMDLAAECGEFLRKPIEKNKQVEEAIGFSAAENGSFDEQTQMKQGDREEEEELMRAINLSKIESQVYEGKVHAEQPEKNGRSVQCSKDKATEQPCKHIAEFLRDNVATQLTQYGIQRLVAGLKEKTLSVLFHNFHFSTMIRYNGSIYLLATDEGFRETSVLWQKLENVNGDGAFFTSNFMLFNSGTPENGFCNEEQVSGSNTEKFSQYEHPISESTPQHGEQKSRIYHTSPPKEEEKSKVEILLPYGGKERRMLTIPHKLYHMLKPHQKEGLDWLWKLHCVPMPGGLVADDMGLGKTLQTTIFLSGLFHSSIIKRALIVSPLSVLDSWKSELNVSGLARRVQLYTTSEKGGLKTIEEEGGILLMSYNMYQKNLEIGRPNKKWDYVVLDEAHKIKNLDAGITNAIKNLKCDHKILLSGTPIMKDAMDMFSLMEFIDVDILGDVATFRKKIINPIKTGIYSTSNESEKNDYLKSLAVVRRNISPYVLRRTKSVLREW